MKNRLFVWCAAMACSANLLAVALCNGNSTGVAIDTTLGTRTAAASETIRYGATWETTASGATAVVAVNGETLASATGTGSVVWTPTRNGTYTLTHQVMNGDVQVGETLTATFVVEGLNPENPVITPASGTTFDTSLTVSMSCPSEDATIHYTTDGSEPSLESPVYKRFRISGKTTIKARAFYENGEGSEVVTAEYALGQCDDPVISLADGTVFQHSDQVVSIACGNEGVLRYTLDGTEPTVASPVYAGPFTISESTVVKARLFSDRFFDSQVVTANLTREWIQVATPVITAVESFTGSKTKVEIACATEGTLVRYTTNGNDPNSHSTKYTGPFYVTEGCTVKAYGVLNDYLNSDIASWTIAKEWRIGDTMGVPDHVFTTGGDVGFVRVTDATAPQGESMKSGVITDNQISELTTQVMGAGTVSFRWKTSCEEDEDRELQAWDHAEFLVDGVEVARQDGVTGWKPVSARVEGAGSHTLVWRYVKDDVEKDGEDCIWVADYAWTSDFTATQTTTVPVPYSWLLANCRDAVDEYDIYETVAKQTAANGHLTVEDCFVAGLDPENPAAELKAVIEVVDGEVRISWTPNLNTETVTRIYTVYGRTDLDKGDWETPVQPWHRFFKVSVAMPTGAAGEQSAVAGGGFVPEEKPLGGVQLWENGPYWAECNVGATKPEEYGYYFWWGDTVGYTRGSGTWNGGERYDHVTWVSSTGMRMSSSPFSQYFCPIYDKSTSALQEHGYIDSMGNFVARYDAASAHLGAPWRMPTSDEMQALVDNCTTTWTTLNGVSGRLVTGKGAYASKSIFLPNAGYGVDSYLYSLYGGYLSSTPHSNVSNCAWALDLGRFNLNDSRRDRGQSVRPVRGFAK